MNFKIIAAVCAFACASVFATESPTQVVQKKDAELQSLIRKSALSAKEKERIKSLLSDVFDFELLAQKSLPAATWKSMDDATRAKFVSEFQRMVRNSSAKKLEMYRTDSTRYDAPKMTKGNTEARLAAHLWYKGKQTVLEYRMTLKDDKWMAWDLVIDDLSTARNYKEQFGKILETKNIQDLIEILRKKADAAE